MERRLQRLQFRLQPCWIGFTSLGIHQSLHSETWCEKYMKILWIIMKYYEINMELRAWKASSVECWALWMGKHGLRMIKMGKKRGVTVASFRLSRKQNSGTCNVQKWKVVADCQRISMSKCSEGEIAQRREARLEAVKTTARLGQAGRLGRSPWSSDEAVIVKVRVSVGQIWWKKWNNFKDLQSCNSSTWPGLPHIASRNVGAQKGLCHSWKMIPTSVIRFLMAYLEPVGLIQLEHQPQIRVNSDATRKLQLRCPGTSNLELGTLHSSPPANFAHMSWDQCYLVNKPFQETETWPLHMP